ncbi:putative queuine tRNA-ribosyltransferase [Triangularia verruculosa]|uniref:Queuine tRNA-ribosyltransferase accessory subunit 2 n=1 Tax=Triangularia verruculosa TaxID=2587418 RepID=A0AAN7AXI3_9PEZI|nr:putative queuine tRNA-ribosyltransferase [Triangularia verruculosa]
MTVDIETQEPESTAMRFEVLSSALKESTSAAARIGRLAFPGRRPIDTPNFIAVTSRGTLPHVTPDNISKHLQVSGAYFSLEDFVEKSQQNLSRSPPIFSAPTHPTHPTPLYSFTGTPSHITTILAARRLPAVPSPIGNSTKSISIFTNTGFQNLSTTEYLSSTSTLKPDITIPLADLTNNSPPGTSPTSKRALRMAERTDEWIVDWFSSPLSTTTSTFAPVLPVPYPIQWEYLSRLAEDYLPSAQLSGLAVHDPDIIPDLSSHQPTLLTLPLLSLSNPSNPHLILRHISLGTDLFALPLPNAASDAGIALTFSFPAPSSSSSPPLPLGIDLSLSSYSTSVTPLSPECSCYACTKHHKAYIHHLLQAREMLGWTLLQVHNHAVFSAFFAGVQESIGRGTFEEDRKGFARVYEPEMQKGVGERPRMRGYQYKSQGGEENAGRKKNKPAWQRELGLGGEVVGEGVQTLVEVMEGDGREEVEGRGVGVVVRE